MSDSHNPSYGQLDAEYAARLANVDLTNEGPVWMVNLMSYHDVAQYPDGDRGLSGRDADDLYNPVKILAELGAEVVFFGEVDAQLMGDSPEWDRVAVVKYPTRKSFLDLQDRDDFKEKHHHKNAGMKQTFILGSVPIGIMQAPASVNEVAWTDVPHPPTAQDGPVVAVHLIRYQDAEDADVPHEVIDNYNATAAEVAMKHGVRISGWFAVEGTIVGDGRAWDQVRFNQFPSEAAFMAVVMDPVRLEALGDYREATSGNTYTLIVRAGVDRLKESIFN